MKNKLLVVHDVVHDYRLPLFEELANKYDMTLAFRLGNVNIANANTIKLNFFKIGGYVFYFGLNNLARANDVIILPLDLHYPQLFILSLFFRKKVIWFGHGFGRSCLARYVKIFFVKLCAATFVYYDGARDRFIQKGINPNKIFVTYNTIQIKKPQHWDGVRDHFLYLGRLQSRKKLLDACKAIAILKDLLRSAGVSFWIVGEGNRKELSDYIFSNQLEDIIIFRDGSYSEEKLSPYFQGAIAYVSPGPVGLGVLHAFAYGVPVVTPRNERHGPEYENIQGYKNSLLYDSGIDGLVDCLRFLVINRSVSTYLGYNGYQLYAGCRSMDNMVAAISNGIDYVATN